jgi:hypothetical protein
MRERLGITAIEEVVVVDALVMLFVDDDDVRVLAPQASRAANQLPRAYRHARRRLVSLPVVTIATGV